MPLTALTAISSHLQEQFVQLLHDMEMRGEINDVVAIQVACGPWSASLTAHRVHATEPLPKGWFHRTAAIHLAELQADKSGAVRSATPDKAHFREVERAILESLHKEEWMTVPQCAVRAGYVANSYFRSAIARLVRYGLVVRRRRKLRLNH